MFVLVNHFDSDLGEKARILGVAATVDELVETIEELEDLESLGDDTDWEVSREGDLWFDRQFTTLRAAPTVLRAQRVGSRGWLEIVRAG